eukprot:340392_1
MNYFCWLRFYCNTSYHINYQINILHFNHVFCSNQKVACIQPIPADDKDRKNKVYVDCGHQFICVPSIQEMLFDAVTKCPKITLYCMIFQNVQSLKIYLHKYSSETKWKYLYDEFTTLKAYSLKCVKIQNRDGNVPSFPQSVLTSYTDKFRLLHWNMEYVKKKK